MEAQKLAAELYGADETFFLVNGTTCGIHALIMATCGEDDEIIVQRNAHKSTTGGIILSGARPVYIYPEVSNELSMALAVTPESVYRAIKEHPKAKAVILTNPSYFGICSDLERIIEIVHSHNNIVIVDEAHGPHLNFHEKLPVSALKAGADACVQSTHKIISGMTQSSMLHVRKGRIDANKVKKALQLLHSTSPSYVLMASIDMARMQMATEGEKLLSRTIELAEGIRERVNRIKGLKCFGKEILSQPGAFDLDSTKITINVENTGLTGQEVERILNNEYGIQVEMSTLTHILILITIGDSQLETDALVKALELMVGKYCDKSLKLKNTGKADRRKSQPEQVLSPREAYSESACFIPVEDAEGHVSAEFVVPYPPGIPLVYPGERITKEIIDYIKLLIKEGTYIQGPEDTSFEMIKVVKRCFRCNDAVNKY